MGHNDYIPRKVPILGTPPLSINNPPRGYNQSGIQKRLRGARNSMIDTYHTESFGAYSPRPVDIGNLFYWENQTARSRMIWDNQPELVKLPITGDPQNYSVQYAMFSVQPAGGGVEKKPVKRSFPQWVRSTFFAKPVIQQK